MKIILKNVRLDFANNLKSVDENNKYGCSLLLNNDTDKDQIDFLKATITQVINDYRNSSGNKKFKPHSIFLKEGDTKLDKNKDHAPYVRYDNHWYVNAKRLSEKGEPTIINDTNKELYSGCRVHASINIFVSVKKPSNTVVGAELVAIKFYKDDEEFAGGGSYGKSFASLDEFSSLDDADIPVFETKKVETKKVETKKVETKKVEPKILEPQEQDEEENFFS